MMWLASWREAASAMSVSCQHGVLKVLMASRPRKGESAQLSLHLGGSLSALSLSSEGTRAAVAGREILRLVTISDGKLEDTQNLLTHTRKTMNLNSTDVQWRPKHASQLATGAPTGDVLLWDAEKRGDTLLRTLKGHTRAVNRLSFNPAEPARLLSAAQERAVRLWDVGAASSKPQLSFHAAAEVRDVQSCPTAPHRFGVALENGMLQVFDTRNNRTHVMQSQAHSGPSYVVEWHPTEANTIVTGGRDRLIKAWELEPTAAGSGAAAGPAAGSAALTCHPAYQVAVTMLGPVARIRCVGWH